jgi:hypothetical protein
MDDKSYSATDANNETAPTPPVGAIKMTATGTSDKTKLNDCYFMQVVAGTPPTTTYTLYNKNGVVLKTGLTSGNDFSFDHDKQNPSNPSSAKINWQVTSFVISSTAASGNWSNDDPSLAAGPQSGSFTASSGGGIDPVSASASA